ncbi:hypothetical protein EON67_10710 [archaeon]|nr:MAG: hypothetical protein EON67_10710 [archaeon]
MHTKLQSRAQAGEGVRVPPLDQSSPSPSFLSSAVRARTMHMRVRGCPPLRLVPAAAALAPGCLRAAMATVTELSGTGVQIESRRSRRAPLRRARLCRLRCAGVVRACVYLHS